MAGGGLIFGLNRRPVAPERGKNLRHSMVKNPAESKFYGFLFFSTYKSTIKIAPAFTSRWWYIPEYVPGDAGHWTRRSGLFYEPFTRQQKFLLTVCESRPYLALCCHALIRLSLHTTGKADYRRPQT